MAFSPISKLYSVEQVRYLDRLAIDAGTPGIVLMKRAGSAAFELLVERWPKTQRVVVVCGSGNNGGDGFVLAALAAQAGIEARCYCTKAVDLLGKDARAAAYFAQQEAVSFEQADALLALELEGVDNTIVIDALLGTGIRGAMSPAYCDLIRWMNRQAKPVLALDTPSGLDPDTGSFGAACVEASATISFVGVKRGLVTGDGRGSCGNLHFSQLAIAESIVTQVDASASVLCPEDLLDKLRRPPNSHKSMFGHVAVIGGDTSMGGAAILCAEACLDSGAGLTSLHTRGGHITAALARLPEAMANALEDLSDFSARLERTNAIALGPGIGQSTWSLMVTQCALALPQAKVIDADALNLIAAERVDLEVHEDHVYTPHPGEAARLLGVSVNEVQADRFLAARQLQRKLGGVVVLKGAGTIVQSANATKLCRQGNAGMAVGGMGDVLTGLIAALMAQGLCAADAAELGVWLHSNAADDAVLEGGIVGLRASNIIPFIRKRINAKRN